MGGVGGVGFRLVIYFSEMFFGIISSRLRPDEMIFFKILFYEAVSMLVAV